MAGLTGHDERAAQFLEEEIELTRRFGAGIIGLLCRGSALQLDWLAGRLAGLDERVAALVADSAETAGVVALGAQIRGNLAAARGEWKRALDLLGRAARVRGELGQVHPGRRRSPHPRCEDRRWRPAEGYARKIYMRPLDP